jgi:hypothetical protein
VKRRRFCDEGKKGFSVARFVFDEEEEEEEEAVVSHFFSVSQFRRGSTRYRGGIQNPSLWNPKSCQKTALYIGPTNRTGRHAQNHWLCQYVLSIMSCAIKRSVTTSISSIARRRHFHLRLVIFFFFWLALSTCVAHHSARQRPALGRW